MLEESLIYNPELDKAPVDQFGFVNLREAYETGCMPADIGGAEPEYNGVEDPGSLLPHATDQFDAIRKAKSVVSARAAKASNEASSTPEANA